MGGRLGAGVGLLEGVEGGGMHIYVSTCYWVGPAGSWRKRAKEHGGKLQSSSLFTRLATRPLHQEASCGDGGAVGQ